MKVVYDQSYVYLFVFVFFAIVWWQNSRKVEWQEESVDDPGNEKYDLLLRTLWNVLLISFHLPSSQCWCLWLTSYLQMSAGQPDEDDITWGSEELPIENLNSKMTDGQSKRFMFFFHTCCFHSALTVLSFWPCRWANHHWGRVDLSAFGQSGPWRSVHGNEAQHSRQNDEGAPWAEGPTSRVWCKKPLWFLLSRNTLNFIGTFENMCFSFAQNLQNLEPLDDCLIAQTKENKKKNRYKNVVPCEEKLRFLFCCCCFVYSTIYLKCVFFLYMCPSSSWRDSSFAGYRRRLHQRQFHQDVCEGWEIHVHRLPGAVAHHSVWLLANGAGAEVQRDRHDDAGSGRRQSQVSALLARHTQDSRDGGRQAADHAAQRPAPGQLCHPLDRGQRCPCECE